MLYPWQCHCRRIQWHSNQGYLATDQREVLDYGQNQLIGALSSDGQECILCGLSMHHAVYPLLWSLRSDFINHPCQNLFQPLTMTLHLSQLIVCFSCCLKPLNSKTFTKRRQSIANIRFGLAGSVIRYSGAPAPKIQLSRNMPFSNSAVSRSKMGAQT